MTTIDRDGTTLAYFETGQGAESIVLLHGCGLDHTFFEEQLAFLAKMYRVVALDLRGHGRSGASTAGYDMDLLADDVAYLCRRLGLGKSMIVGHSMGGNIALTLQHRHPELVSAILLIDSAVFIPEAQKEQLRSEFATSLTDEVGLAFFQQALRSMCLPSDSRSLQAIDRLTIAPEVLRAVLPAHTTEFDCARVTSRCTVPLAYIHSGMPFVDGEALRQACPQLVAAQTLGAGHLSPLEIPDQINSMIRAFIAMTEQERPR